MLGISGFVVTSDVVCYFFFFQAEDGIRDVAVTGVQTCALPIYFLDLRNLGTTTGFMTLVNWAVGHASLSWTHSSAKTKYDVFLNEITLSGWADVACRNTVHELPVGLTSYIRIPKTPRTEHGKNDLHY